MTQEFKEIDQILDEYAVKHGHQDWQEMYYDEGIEIGTLGIESIAKTYAQQYIDANKELVEMLRQVVYEYEQSEQSFKTILEIKELLNNQ